MATQDGWIIVSNDKHELSVDMSEFYEEVHPLFRSKKEAEQAIKDCFPGKEKHFKTRQSGRYIAESGSKRSSRPTGGPGHAGHRASRGSKQPIDEGTVPMVVAVIADGYVYGASETESSDTAEDPRYWLQLRLDREPYALFRATVPSKLADDLEAQGTSDQVFSDGYEAMRAAAPYMEAEPFYESPEEWANDREELEEAPRKPRGRKQRFEHRHEDDLVKDPTLLPSALANRYERELPQFQAVSSRTTMPRQWDFGNVTELSSGATTIVVTLNVAQGEVSGNATIDGRVIAQARASTADAAISRLMGDVAFELGDDKTPHEATEYRGVVPVRKS